MEAVVQDFQGFEDVAPVLALVIQSLIQHVHNLVEICRAARKTNQFGTRQGQTSR